MAGRDDVSKLSGRDFWPLGAVGFVLTVSAAWWTFALWTVPAAPEWLERARAVCFNITETGLPDAKGWLLLLGQPPAMLCLLLVGWGREVRRSARRLLASSGGRVAALGVAAALLGGAWLATDTVLEARLPAVEWGGDGPAPEAAARLAGPWPAVNGLVGPSGGPFGHGSLHGRPAMVTFAFGHCETLCPVIVQQALAARAELEREWSIVVLTLDPWRDTPSRLGALLTQFSLDPTRDFVVGGSVSSVTEALDAWGVARERDARTGDIVHAGVVFLVESDGTVAYASSGGVDRIVSLARRLQ